MSDTIGKIRRLQQCATADRHFVILAVDHRGNLRQALNPAAPETVSYQAMVRFKQQVVGALAPAASAVLLDPEYGAAQAVASGAVPGQTGLIVALEKTGYEGHTTARESQILPGWDVEKITRMGASAVKLLLYYHPQAPNSGEQEALVRQVAASCRQYDLPFFLEPLSFSLDPAVKKLPSSAKRQVVVETARRLTPLGVDVLKAEFPLNIADEADEKVWTDACLELSQASAAPWVLLSASVSFEQFARQTEVACQAGASGVMAGRAVWKEAADIDGEARQAFLRTVARDRLDRLGKIIAQHGQAWTSFRPNLVIEEGWYHHY
ncbi:MAG: tagatose 1,6-diphosphate aldolase [Chloroflexi bacterium]|nr:tagatose 1,6-diphosphate aldolase [Chloroflexota bacterium]MCI0578086.1 tagatose 1,6-diphosphate aldolase [Chloroflexota bacterium]MCI0646074.1 tagatose 1,6-diphosphate aldolase [Chloroflexota bacterium]MCI0730988.1 tagatose 1,6-diphosphate aldolase [Chloroflexota bacterium]